MASGQVVPKIGEDVTALMGSAPAIGEDVTSLMERAPDFTTSNQKDAAGQATVDPNTLGTVARHLWDGINPVQLGQLLPWPKAAGGSGTDHPFNPQKIANDLYAVKKQAQAAMAKGDYTTAIAKYVESVIPVLGPWMSQQGDQLQRGEYAAAAGDALALAANVAAPKGLSVALEARYPLAGQAANLPKPTRGSPDVQFAQARGIPLDAATASDNLAVKGVQAVADRSLGGSLVATPARARQAAAMTRTGEALAGDAFPTATTPEQAGGSIRDALAAKVAGHEQAANVAYERLRALEEQPSNRMTMPGKPTPSDALTDVMRGQVRRIVHELDAAPYTKRIIEPGKYGSSTQAVEGVGGAGAAVFDDIVQRAGSHATRGTVQNQLETYLGGGPETPIVKAALEVAGERNQARGGYSVSRPELPPNAMEVPTRLEGKVTGQEMGFPVDVKAAKAALRPVYDQMMRQLPITQQQANPGLKAIANILDGPDYGSLSQIDRDLSAIKGIARQQGGLAKYAVSKLEGAVQQAAGYGGPDVVKTLQAGREATKAKYAASDVLDRISVEPVKAMKALTAPKDAAIEHLRAVAAQVPDVVPQVARGYLEDLLDSPQKVATWNKLGDSTKQTLFPKPGQIEALDRFFSLTDRISKTNVNPSGSGYVASLGAQGAMLWYDPIHAVPLQISAAMLSKLLRSPTAVHALTQGLSMSMKLPSVVRAGVTARLLAAARGAGVSLAPATAQDPTLEGSR